jgi:spermidine dehydrogenase
VTRVTDKSDSELGMDRPIARRDFLQGAAIGAAALAAAPTAADGEAQNAPGYYPPTRQGMRGSHPGAFEAAHELRDGEFWRNAQHLSDDAESYDLVVVGGGISGLSAAHFYRAARPRARILILENHDDFGGHAKRNEFHVGGGMQIINGGTFDIDSPRPYSAVADGLLRTLGVDAERLARDCAKPAVYESLGLSTGMFFDRGTFGADRLVVTGTRDLQFMPAGLKAFLDASPLTPAVRRDIYRIETGMDDPYSGLSSDEKKARLARVSYRDYLHEVLKTDPGIIPYYQHRTDSEWACGIDAVSAIDAWGFGLPGFQRLKLAPGATALMGYTPAGYEETGGSPTFHFPDGNASIARLLVRNLIPEAVPGHDARDIVTAKVDYAQLDRSGAPVRLRLNALAVRARNVKAGVEIAYAPSAGGGSVHRVRATHCVLAGWNMMIPYLCPEMSEMQKTALHSLVKAPLVYANVALTNWHAFAKLKVDRVHAPGCYFLGFTLSRTIDIGGYVTAHSPDEPITVLMERTPARPGLSEYDQNRAGRAELLATSFETFERHIREQLGRTLQDGGFDPARDIAGIMVNRWPHGYAPEYNALFDGDPAHQPYLVARRRFGRIAIANSDSGFAAYTDSAIDQAHRAVTELMDS